MESLNSSRCFIIKTVIVGIMIAIAFRECKSREIDNPLKTSPKRSSSSSRRLRRLCEMTAYPTTCKYYYNLGPLIEPSEKNGINDSLLLFYKLSIQASTNEVSRVSTTKVFSGNKTLITSTICDDIKDDISLKSAVESCRILFSLALYNLNRSMPPTISNSTTVTLTHENVEDYKTWLSAADADLETCKDSFEYASDRLKRFVVETLDNSTKLVGNSLSIISKINGDDHSDEPSSKRLTSSADWPPSWLSSEDRKLLVHDSEKLMNPDVVVATDGSGKYKTINEAINVAPQNSTQRFIIYVKKGVYFENVMIDVTKWNIMMYGDGMDQTIVSASRSNGSGVQTFMTATFAAHGTGFIARDMGFRNTAGPANFQAVALSSSSDKSVFYRCKIDAYQDSLFTRSNRQFYRECRISGTIDFIFGRASVVIQNTTILVKKPLSGQENTITSDGRWNPKLFSGISIQKCVVSAAEDLGGARTFLGRPYKNFSTTIFMESLIDGLIDPLGWLPFTPNVVPPNTIYYAEYKNRGPGAVTTGRVQWKGLRLNITAAEAQKFTVRSFINGLEWLPQTGVPFQPDL